MKWTIRIEMNGQTHYSPYSGSMAEVERYVRVLKASNPKNKYAYKRDAS